MGLAVHFLQSLPLHLQFHLRILLEDLCIALSKELCNPLVGAACTEPRPIPEADRSVSTRLREETKEPDNEVRGVPAAHEKSPKTQVQTTNPGHTATETAWSLRETGAHRRSSSVRSDHSTSPDPNSGHDRVY
jgi:hypothetical protein